MGTIYKGAIELVGKTPLVELVNLEKREGLKARLLAKVEYFNPAGSVKDRVGKAMIEAAEQSGELKPGAVIKMCIRDRTSTARRRCAPPDLRPRWEPS